MIPENLVQNLVKASGLEDVLYDAIRREDLVEAVSVAKRIMQPFYGLMKIELKQSKSETESAKHRSAGNEAYAGGEGRSALELYNRALMMAPSGSRAGALAYANRSALLLRAGAFAACLKDIEVCSKMDLPAQTLAKLTTRKEEAQRLLWFKDMVTTEYSDSFIDQYFQFSGERNPEIPSASADLQVQIERSRPKIVAANDISVGTVVALETAFVRGQDDVNVYISCYYCLKQSLNLTPCSGCCFVLFCSEQCKKSCWEEYHSVECEIMELIVPFAESFPFRLFIKAFLKMKHMCKSWSELISASHTLGSERVRESSINEIYGENSKFSLLSCWSEEKCFLHHFFYDSSFGIALIISAFERIPSFLPKRDCERSEAINAISRIMMYLFMHSKYIHINMATKEQAKTCNSIKYTKNVGLFSLTGKLRHSCNPNVIAVGLNDKLALVAMQPIKRGSELTVFYLGYKNTNITSTLRRLVLWQQFGVACRCPACKGELATLKYKLTEKHRKCLRQLGMNKVANYDQNYTKLFPKLCEALECFSDLPHTKEHADIYESFHDFIMYMQYIATKNTTLG